MEKYAAIILGAGKGTRMNEGRVSSIPKVMFEVCGRPIIHYAVEAIKKAGIKKIVLIVGYKKEMIEDYMSDKVEYAVQEEQLGTGHAVMMAKEALKDKAEAILICYGDMPLFNPETIKRLMADYENERPTIAMLSVVFENPEHWAYGRLVRNERGGVIKSIEQKDCTPEELKIKECNPCFYIFNAHWLWQNLDQLKTENVQKEYYLTDLIGIACEQGKKIIAVKVSEETEALGINTPEHLKQAEEILRLRGK